ncbi:MAG: hypothetical protein LBS29_00145 [Endomicrobium sp.]|jgi:LPS-assembly protein|nr:hypothetical protein [Endomicrobium sp.]
MFKFIFKNSILVFFTLTYFSCLAFCSDVDISADNLEYLESKSLVTADGNVIVGWQGKKVYADHIEFLIDKKILNAAGHVQVKETGTTLAADSISYKYDEETGDLKQVFSYSSFIFMRAKEMDGKGKKTFEVRGIKLSNCDLEEPHTHFRSKKGKLVLDKRITIYNAIFYVGKLPVFYLPIVTKSLKGDRGFGSNLRIKLIPGYEYVSGYTLETAIGCSLSENSFGEFLYDYHGRRGNGYGGNFNYVNSTISADLHLYTIKDLIDNKEKWEIKQNYFQRLNKNWIIRSQANLKNSRTFNEIYNRNNVTGIENWTQSYFTATRQTSVSNLLLKAGYDVRYNKSASKYEPSLIELPSLKWRFVPRKIFWNIVYSRYFEFNHKYSKHRADKYFYRNEALAKYSVTRDFKVSKRLILRPSLDLAENWYDIDELENYNNSFYTKYGASLDTRYRLTSWIDLKAKYFYMARMQPNSFKLDKEQNDYGIEDNKVTLINCMFVGDRTTITNSINYDFKYNRTILNKKWWFPLNTEIMWTPKYNMVVSIIERHYIEPFQFESFKLDTNIGHFKKSRFKHTLVYQHYNDKSMAYKNNRINNILGFAFWITPKWRIDYRMTTSATLDLKYFSCDTHRLLIYRDLHCYNFGILLGKDVGKNDIYWKIEMFDLKINMPFSKSKQNFDYDDPEEMFYPWQDNFPSGL